MFIIKQLRRKKNINQTDLAYAIGVSLRTIQLYEKNDANIPIKNLTKIAAYFDVSISQLYSLEVNENNIVYDKQNKRSKKGHSIGKLAPGKYLLTVPLAIVEEHLNFAGNYNDQEYLNALVRIGFVIDQVSVAHYMAFEIANNSMNNGEVESLTRKTIVLGKQVNKRELASKLKDKSGLFWIIVYKDGIMCKEITDYDKKSGTISCHSLNNSPEYPDFNINIEDVKQLFIILKKQVD